jgi:hypothetical protein
MSAQSSSPALAQSRGYAARQGGGRFAHRPGRAGINRSFASAARANGGDAQQIRAIRETRSVSRTMHSAVTRNPSYPIPPAEPSPSKFAQFAQFDEIERTRWIPFHTKMNPLITH